MRADFPDSPALPERAELLATFLICCSMLAFEVLTVRAVNFAIGPSYIFIAISLAMLGLTAAGSLLSQVTLRADPPRRRLILGLLCLGIAGLLIVAHLSLTATKDVLNAQVRAAGIAEGLRGVVSELLIRGVPHAFKIGAILALPYFLFGALLSFLFATAPPQRYARLYAADLLGAAFGCALIVGVMEVTGYATSITVPALLALAAGAVYLIGSRPVLPVGVAALALLLGLLSQTEDYRHRVEPRADANYLVRDYRAEAPRAERWTGWNSFTRVSVVEETARPGEGAVLSLANGDGMAFLNPFRPDGPPAPPHAAAIPALIAGPADRVLVVFAGAGADMMTLRDAGSTDLVGLELNGKLIEAGQALPAYGLDAFMAQDGIDLRVTEARTFLERDPTQYDMVLVSWSGATAVYHLGALGGTTQHLFTYEGLSAILDRLTPDGVAVILQVNKFDMLHGLRRYMAARDLPGADRAAIVLYGDEMTNEWDGTWDDNPLLIKPSGWSAQDIAAIRARATDAGFRIAYAPDTGAAPAYRPYAEILTASDPEAAVARISDRTHQRMGVAPDDRPFVMDHVAPGRLLQADFWQPDMTQEANFTEASLLMRLVFMAIISVLATVLAVAPLLLSRRKLVSRRRSAVWLGYFTLLGAGFMFVEIGLIQRLGILFGNPGVTIAVVLGLIILSTGLGSLISEASFDRGLRISVVGAAAAVYAVFCALAAPAIVGSVLGAGLVAKLAVTAGLILPGGVILGHLFPQGLALAGKEDRTLVPWAWAINGAMSACIAGLAPIVAQMAGFQALFWIGAGLYALVLVLPLGARHPSRAAG